MGLLPLDTAIALAAASLCVKLALGKSLRPLTAVAPSSRSCLRGESSSGCFGSTYKGCPVTSPRSSLNINCGTRFTSRNGRSAPRLCAIITNSAPIRVFSSDHGIATVTRTRCTASYASWRSRPFHFPGIELQCQQRRPPSQHCAAPDAQGFRSVDTSARVTKARQTVPSRIPHADHGIDVESQPVFQSW